MHNRLYEMKETVTVIGLGYIGLPTAVALAGAGHLVKGYDANIKVREQLKKGRIHIIENHLQEAFAKVLKTGRLEITDAPGEASVYVICVPTPLKEKEGVKTADVTYVKEAAKTVGKLLKRDDLVILESTVPPGTTDFMADILAAKSGLERKDFLVSHCPERVLPGRILQELKANDRIIGADEYEAGRRTKALYETFVREGTCYLCGTVMAELCKLAENTYRDINIAYANQLSMLCAEAGLDVFELIDLANKHPRVDILKPGLGVGGHCLAVDPWFIADVYGERASLIQKARRINEEKPLWVKEQVIRETHGDRTKVIGILGMTYKPDIDDMRESPSLILAHALEEEGYSVLGCEPNSKAANIEGILLLPVGKMAVSCDYFVLAQAHEAFKNPKNWEQFSKKPIYDCIGFTKTLEREA